MLARLIPASLLATPVLAQGGVLYSTDFRTLDGWTVTSTCGGGYTWASDRTPLSLDHGGAFRSPPHSLNFNNGTDIGGLGAHGGAYVSCGTVQSPPIDLSASFDTPLLRFWVRADMETACEWDAIRVIIEPVGGGAAFLDDCINDTHGVVNTWEDIEIALDRNWGVVTISFAFDALDDWWNQGGGAFIDDLRVLDGGSTDWSLHCKGIPREGATESACLLIDSATSLSDGTVQFRGKRFHASSFATLFGGAQPAILPAGNGHRCIGAGQSYRLAVAPTREGGTPVWNLDVAGSAIAGVATSGSTFFFQSIYRDDTSFNFSDAVRVRWSD